MPEPALPNTLAECHALLKEMAAVHAQDQTLLEHQQAVISQQQTTIDEQQATIAQQQATIDEQQVGLKTLLNEVALLKRSLFGHRRERFLDPHQLLLFDAVALAQSSEAESPEASEPEPEHELEKPPKRTRRRGRARRVIPDCLPRVSRYRDLDENDIPQELRGQSGRRFYKKAGEYLEWQPAQLYVVEEYVEVLAIDNEDATETAMITAAKQPRILNCFIGPAMLAYFVTSRFADHLPYYRLEEILRRSRISIDRSTLCRWMIRLALVLLPLVERMRELALQSEVCQADEMSVKRLVPGQGQASKAYLWAVLGSSRFPYTFFHFTEDRSRAGPDTIFADFEGVLLSDAYICYELTSADSNGRIRLAGCYAHARRKFEELNVLGPTERTATALGYFQRLFLIEDELKDLSEEDRHEQRQLRSRPIVEQFKTWLDQQLKSLLPKHELRGAIEYMTNRWECFTRFLESGQVPLSNNASEQAVKLPILGRKAWLFFGSAKGGLAAAVFYTLTATCRRLHIDPLAYLTDVFERLPFCDVGDETALDSFLPDHWLAAHPESRLEMRVEEAQEKAARQRTRREKFRRALARAEAQGS